MHLKSFLDQLYKFFLSYAFKKFLDQLYKFFYFKFMYFKKLKKNKIILKDVVCFGMIIFLFF